MPVRKIPVNWTIDRDIWDAIQRIVTQKSNKAGVKISTSAIANQLLKAGLEKQEGN